MFNLTFIYLTEHGDPNGQRDDMQLSLVDMLSRFPALAGPTGMPGFHSLTVNCERHRVIVHKLS